MNLFNLAIWKEFFRLKKEEIVTIGPEDPKMVVVILAMISAIFGIPYLLCNLAIYLLYGYWDSQWAEEIYSVLLILAIVIGIVYISLRLVFVWLYNNWQLAKKNVIEGSNK